MDDKRFLLYLRDIIDCLAVTDQEELHGNKQRLNICTTVPL